MQESFPQTPEKFSSPEAEANFLRERIRQLEAQERQSDIDTAHETVTAYQGVQPEEVLTPEYQMPESSAEKIVLELAPEEHDAQMSELIGLLQKKGIRNVLSVLQKMDNAHLTDDFHRFLVQYIREGHPVPGMKEGTRAWNALHMTLYQISLSSERAAEKPELAQVLRTMEQFYAGMTSVVDVGKRQKREISFELAVPQGAEDSAFYISVPQSKKDVFEKQILSIFPNVRIDELKDDYNIFHPEGATTAVEATLSRHPILPLKTYETFEHDPLNVILSAFSKLQKDGEGIALQILFRPVGSIYSDRYQRVLEKLQKGETFKDALGPESIGGAVFKELGTFMFGGNKKTNAQESASPTIDQASIELVKEKLGSQIVEVNIRLVASAKDMPRAATMLNELQAAFSQFEHATGNRLVFKTPSSRRMRKIERAYSFREFSSSAKLPLSIRELTSMYHLSSEGVTTSRELKRSKTKQAPAPVAMPTDGILLGENVFGNSRTPVYFSEEDRLRHLYTIGQTGTGKSSLLKNMIIQDIHEGNGVCMIDPHGSDVEDVLASVPEHRREDVIYFDPSFTERPMGLNLLEYDLRFPEQKTFVVNELFSIFQKLYGNVPESMGPMFEQYFRNATMLVIEDPATGSTLLDVSRVLADEHFRNVKLSRCGNPIVVQFWKDIAGRAEGEAALANIVPYITSKFDVFLANDFMRPIIAQEKSAFNFREIMDNRKLLLVNLSKGRLGEMNANLIGLIIVGKFLMAALSRVDADMHTLAPFYLYIDEFQNVTTPSIATILSEARKYKLSLTVAHQFLAQLDENTRDAVIGNVGSKCVFRVGTDDAEYLERQFAPAFTAHDLVTIDNYNAYVAMLVGGKPAIPFNLELMPPKEIDRSGIGALKQAGYEKYGRSRTDIEKEILAKYK